MNTGFSINGDSYLLYELASIVEGTFSLSVKSGLLSGEALRIEVRQPLSLPVETDSPLIILLFLL